MTDDLPRTLIDIARAGMAPNRDKRIDTCIEENPGEWFVYLKPGYHYDGAHCFGEDTLADVRKTMRLVKPCNCEECTS